MHYIVFIAFFGIFLLATSGRRLSLGIAVSIGSAFAIFAVFAAQGSWDYRGYQELYECSISADCRSSKKIEETFWTAARATRSVFGDDLGFPILLASYVVPAVALKIWVMFHRAPSFGFALFSYGCWFFFLMELTQVRAALAVGVAWLAIYLRAAGLNAAAVLSLGIAIGFHNSAVAAVPLFFLRKFELNHRWQLLGLGVCVIVGQVLAYLMLRLPLEQFANWGRVGLYLSVSGRSVMDVNLVNVSALSVLAVYMSGISVGRRAGLEVFERLALKAVWLALCFYALTYWIPGVGLRVFEFLGTFSVIVASGVYRHSGMRGRVLITSLFVCIFLNLLVRNGLRTDFVLPWHPAELQEAASAMRSTSRGW